MGEGLNPDHRHDHAVVGERRDRRLRATQIGAVVGGCATPVEANFRFFPSERELCRLPRWNTREDTKCRCTRSAPKQPEFQG
jgi:hypothetical protein